MITFHPAARPVSNGFLPMVTLRAAKGRMVGSKVSQNGRVYATASEAFAVAVASSERVVAANLGSMRIAAL
jgi:hypothetical protein